MVWLGVLGVPLLLLLGGSFGLSRLEQSQAERLQMLDEREALIVAITAHLLARLQAMQVWNAQWEWSSLQKEKEMR